jgi:hypothetical protein
MSKLMGNQIFRRGSKSSEDNGEAKTNCRITLYKNGFRINDGELRDYEAPENKQFMTELNQQ